MSDLVRAAIATIVDGGTLSADDAHGAMGAVMDGEATPAQLAALLMGLRMRGETVDELTGFALAMRERVVRVDAPEGTIDVVGTGGDGSGTFNISTTAALVAAAAGVPVAKHGNRAITSRAGSADVLDALGIRIDHDQASAGAALRELGFAFMFAPSFHPAMRHAGPTRREIGVRTDRIRIATFMILGSLAALTGVITATVIGSAAPDAGGSNLTLLAIAAAVIGGTALTGGSGTVIGALIGAFVVASLNNGLVLLGAQATQSDIYLGAAIVAAMILNVQVNAVRLRRKG